jgi:hypothetical protein
MPNSYRIRTQVGVDKVLQVNLDQDYDTLEVLSMALFPNDVYTRNCADFGVVCGRVFANKGLGLVNARVSIFIPIDQVDESNPIISTLYPYKSFEDFNEDGYKYNLLPYSPSHSGHVPVGTFPDRLDALTNESVIEVYDKYYKFTAKTNDAGDYMIFGIPIGEYDLFMQVDLSDIGEFSLTPQDLIRMGLATENQVNGTKFKFSENYSELPQIVTLKKVIQIAPFYGQDGICQHYITRADFDITSEANVEIIPTSVFIGSLISAKDKKKLKRRCRVPSKQGWLCDMISGPGQIEAIRHTVFSDDEGLPVLEQYRLQNDGKLIDENGAWMVELPMNLDYVYTDENGIRQISPDGSVGVPIRGRYRFKIKWQQSPSLREENKRAYFLVPNIKEQGWTNNTDPNYNFFTTQSFTFPHVTPANNEPPSSGPFDYVIPTSGSYYNFQDSNNISSYVVLVDGVERPDMKDTIPMNLLQASVVAVRYTLVDPLLDGTFIVQVLEESEFRMQSSYAFSVSWSDYGTPDMVQEAVNCEDRFYEFQYNKVYTVSQLIDRYSNRYFPQKSIQIKHVTDNKCEGQFNTFPTNDVYYRYDFLFIAINFILTLFKPIMTMIVIFLHVLAFLWPVIATLLILVWGIQQLVYGICKLLDRINLRDKPCNEPRPLGELLQNPFKNIAVPLFLYTEDGCERCRCKVEDQELDEANNQTLYELVQNQQQIDSVNVSYLADIALISSYNVSTNGNAYSTYQPYYINNDLQYADAVGVMLAGNGANDYRTRKLPVWRGNIDGVNTTIFSPQLTFPERMNLFNTKAKYFDNLTENQGSESLENRIGGSLSPGNTGWNQVKVTWNPDSNDPDTTFHFDNLIVLLVDNTGFTRGDILTFQNPNDSLDPNVDVAQGIKSYPGSVIVRYANPNTAQPDIPLKTTIYDMSDAYSNNSGVVGIGLDGVVFNQLQSSEGDRVTSCYPMDIEYFQVIKEISYQDFRYYTNTAPPTSNSDRRFSLPWRFLRSDTAGYKDSYTYTNGTPTFGNGMGVFREYQVNQNEQTCFDACFSTTTHPVGNYDMVRSFTPSPDVEPIPFEDRPNPNLRIIFLQRGVDPNAPDIEMRFDLRRYFGLANAYSSAPTLDLGLPLGPSYDITGECIVQGRFKPNQPILPGGDVQVGFNANNSSGWAMIGQVTAIALNGQPIINPEYQFLALLSSNIIQTTALIPLGPLEESPSILPDNNDIFNGGILTAPLTGTFRIRIVLRYSGNVNNPNGLGIFIRDLTDGVFILSETTSVNTNISNYSEFFNLDLIENHEYQLQVRPVPLQDITYYADTLSWTDDNTFGLKLPKHNEIQNNSDLTNRGTIFFPSQFFTYDADQFTGFTTTMPTYYSALDEDTLYFSSEEGHRWKTYTVGTLDSFILQSESFANPIGIKSQDQGGPRNLFTQVLLPIVPVADGGGSDGFRIPCAYSDTHGSNMQLTCGNEPSVTVSTEGNSCDCQEDNTGCAGCCRYRVELRTRLHVYHDYYAAHNVNEVGSYWGQEYVEGGSAMGSEIATSQDYGQTLFGDSIDCVYNDPAGQGWFGSSNDPQWNGGGGACSNGCTRSYRRYIEPGFNIGYISPCYATFPENVDPSPGFQQFFDSIEDARRYWYVNPNHTIEINNRVRNVFRTDRLPSSDTPQTDNNGNGYLLHQNNGFSIYRIDRECNVTQLGGGDIETPPISDTTYSDLPGGEDSPIANVARSLSECYYAVDLNSYYTDSENNPMIYDEGGRGYSRQDANLGADWIWFKRTRGCYNFVSKPLASLFPHSIPDDPEGKFYWDIASIVEWIQRLKLTFAQCFEIFSHTFSNNWINGTLYAFPFQNQTIFDDQNQPIRRFCRDVIYFHNPLNNYYYRSSPWNGSDFVGKPITENDDRGNKRNLLYPTTIMDMGPKNSYIQELVYSDEYDGYIVNRIPSTTYQDTTDLLNLFVLSRLIDANFLQLLIPLPVDEGGNEEGSDDPSIGAMFSNTRWKNGEIYALNLLPGLIDADYAQMISINSEFGVNEYSPETYTNNDIFFGKDEGIPGQPFILGFSRGGVQRITRSNRPVFAIYMSGDNQLRDYITPRRTIWDEHATFGEIIDSDFTDIGTKSQVVPFYQWNVFHDRAEEPSVFGYQSNNFITEFDSNEYTNSATFPNGFFNHRYQTLDRLNPSSEYFRPDGDDTFYYKGYLINFEIVLDSSGNPIVDQYGNPLRVPTFQEPQGASNRYTFGAPFHFYFGLVQGGTAMDLFIQKYVDTNIVYE